MVGTDVVRKYDTTILTEVISPVLKECTDSECLNLCCQTLQLYMQKIANTTNQNDVQLMDVVIKALRTLISRASGTPGGADIVCGVHTFIVELEAPRSVKQYLMSRLRIPKKPTTVCLQNITYCQKLQSSYGLQAHHSAEILTHSKSQWETMHPQLLSLSNGIRRVITCSCIFSLS